MAAANTNISLQQPLTEDQNQFHQQQGVLIRRSSGRRKTSKGNEAKKNKPAQRGMGVEKLEKLRIHEESLKKKLNNPNQSPMALINPYQFCGFGAPNVGFGQLGLMNHNNNSYNNLGFQYGQMDLFGSLVGRSSTVSGLSSTPSGLNNLNNNEYCRNANCHKKKRFNGENFGRLVKSDDNQNIIKENQLKLPLVPRVRYAARPVHPGVEVLAVHKKGSNLISNQEEGSDVVMEYKFFPSGRKDSNNDELLMMKMEDNNPKAAFSSASASCVTHDGSSLSSCIDLSLKLSY